jgi:hypothetical protein
VKRPAPARYRAWIAAAVLVVALVAGWWLNRGSEPEAPPVAEPAANPAPPPARALPRAQQAANPSSEAPSAVAVVDIFAPHTWEPAPPPLAAFVPPPPQAPPLPFRFMGRIAEPGETPEFLLLEGDRVLRVKAGERVGRGYRLEKFEDGKLYFRYQPMNVVQTLPVGTAQ